MPCPKHARLVSLHDNEACSLRILLRNLLRLYRLRELHTRYTRDVSNRPWSALTLRKTGGDAADVCIHPLPVLSKLQLTASHWTPWGR